MIDLNLPPPEEWRQFDAEDIEATLEAYAVICRLIEDGHQVDLVDVCAEDRADIKTVEVSINRVPPGAFRFFEGHRFEFVR